MADPIRRSHARHPCDLPVQLMLGAVTGSPAGEGRLIDLSLGGGHLLCERELMRGTPYRLRVAAPDGPLELPFRVVREGSRGGKDAPKARRYGLVFNLSSDQERRLRALVDVVRRAPEPPGQDRVDRSMRDYWA